MKSVSAGRYRVGEAFGGEPDRAVGVVGEVDITGGLPPVGGGRTPVNGRSLRHRPLQAPGSARYSRGAASSDSSIPSSTVARWRHRRGDWPAMST